MILVKLRAVSSHETSDKRPVFSLTCQILGVLGKGALPRAPKCAINAKFSALPAKFWAFWEKVRCLEPRNERKTPSFQHYLPNSGRFAKRCAASSPETNEKRPVFSLTCQILGVLGKGALPRAAKRAKNARFSASSAKFWAFCEKVRRLEPRNERKTPGFQPHLPNSGRFGKRCAASSPEMRNKRPVFSLICQILGVCQSHAPSQAAKRATLSYR